MSTKTIPLTSNAYNQIPFNSSRYNPNLKSCSINLTLQSKTFETNIVEVPFHSIKSAAIDMCTQPSLAPSKMYTTYSTKPNILTNAGLFITAKGTSIFNLKSNNEVYSVDNNYQWGFGVYNTPTQPDPNDLSTYNPFVQGTYWSPSKWRDYVTSYPMLIQNSKDVTTTVGNELNYSAHRCVWGWTDTKLFNITIEGNGATFSEIKQIVRTLYPSVEYCANLDGGGSVCALVDGKKITDEGWERPVDSVVCVWVLSTAEEEELTRVEQNGFDAEKPEDTEDVKEDDNTSKKLYRVQLGAFSVEANCKNFLAEVQKIKTDLNDYSNAYMRKAGNLWKVQVGAFSVKENAERMAKDLEALGYSTYITTN